MTEAMRLAPRRHRPVRGLPALLFSATILAVGPVDADTGAEERRARRVYLNCITETSDEYAGVEFKLVIDPASETVRVSRWGEPVDVNFGPSFITYRTTGMALKMAVSINRETWQFTMLHDGGVFVVTGACKEKSG